MELTAERQKSTIRTIQPHVKSTEQMRAPWPFKTCNGKPILPPEKFDPSKFPDAPF